MSSAQDHIVSGPESIFPPGKAALRRKENDSLRSVVRLAATMSLLDAHSIFTHNNIKAPVQIVLYAPMGAYRFGSQSMLMTS